MSKSDDSSRKSLLALKGAGPLGCAICHTQFPTPAERIQHARDKHNVHKSKFPCTACNLTGFSLLSNLQNHIQAKCLGVGWEARLINNSGADLSSSALNDEKGLALSEEPLKCNRSKSSSIDSTEGKALKQIRRPSLRSSKLEKSENCGANSQEICEALMLTQIDESVTFSSSLPLMKRRMSDTVEQPVKIFKKELKSVENVPTNKGAQLEIIVTESTQNDKTAVRRTRQTSSIDTKPYVSKLTKSRKTSNLLYENPAKDTTDKISIQVSRTEPEKFDIDDEYTKVKVEASNLTHISETPESKSFDKTLPLRKRRISAKSSKKELKSEETDDMANKEEPEHAIKSAPPKIVSAVPGENLENVSVSDTGAMKKTRANSSSKIESGFSSLTSQKLQNYKKSPSDVQEPGKKSILDSIITTHESESPLDDIFSSRRRRVLTKIPKKNSKSIESGLFDYGERNRKQEQESESNLMASESIIRDKNGSDDNQDRACASEHLYPMIQTRSGSSSVVSSGVTKVTKEKLKKSRIFTVKSVVLSDQKGILPFNDLSVIDNSAKSSNRLLPTSQDKSSVDVKKSPSHFHSPISNSKKTAKKSRLWKIQSEKHDPSNIPVKKGHSPYAHKSLVRAASLKTKKLTGFFRDSFKKGYKQKYSLDSAGASCESLCNDHNIPKNAIGDSHLEIIVEEKSVSQNSSKESKSKSVFKEPLELFRKVDSKIMVFCDQMQDSLKPSKEPQQSKAEDISKVTGESIGTPIVSKDMESASALASTSAFRKRMNLKISGKRSKGVVKSHQNSSTKTLNVKTFAISSKAEETTALEPVDTSLDAKRLELKRLRESLGLDFSHTPRSTTSSISSNASGSSALGSPQPPKATFGGLNLLKSSRSTSNPSTQLTAIMPKAAEKFALLDWDSFIAKASSKSRTPTVQIETIKKLKMLVDMKIKKVVSPKTPIVSNVEEKSATGPLSEEADDSLETTEKTTVSITPESPSKPSMETKLRLQDCEAEPLKSGNFSATSDSSLISEKPSLTSKTNTLENSESDIQKKDPKSAKVSAEDISMNSEMSTGSRIPEHAEETRMEVESDLAIQNRQIAGSPPNYEASLLLKSFHSLLIFSILQELDDSHDVIKNDDESSVSTVPCYGESFVSDSDRESDQNEKMSMLSCPVCHLGGFATKAELKVHLTISCREEEPQKKVIKKRKRPIKWYCPGCPRSFGPFESAKALLDHLPTCHIKRAAFFNGESKTGKGKGRNLQIDPKDLPFWPAPLPSTPVTYGCPVCGCFFATASRLDQHRSEADHFHVVGRFLKTNGHFKSSK